MNIETLQSRLKDARIERNSVKIKALTSAISDLQLGMGRATKEFTVDQVLNSVRKTRDVILEQIAQIENLDPARKTEARAQEGANLGQQAAYLASFLPVGVEVAQGS